MEDRKYELEILPKERTVQNPKGCIVFVHGICHAAWCWKFFIKYFSEHGYQCYAVSLRGHGGSKGYKQLHSFGLSDYVDDVKFAVETCVKESGMKPFLVGHSMGGAVVQRYIGKYGDTIRGAVLFAPATAPKLTRSDVIRLDNRNLFFATMIALGFKSKRFTHNAAFFTGKDENGKTMQRIADTSEYRLLLQKESRTITGNLIKDGDLVRENYSNNHSVDIPILVIGSDSDLYFPRASLEQTAGQYAQSKKTALVILEYLCHDMMLDPDWKRAAKPVLDFVNDPLQFADKPDYHRPREE